MARERRHGNHGDGVSAIVAFFVSPIGRLVGIGILAALIAGSAATWATATIYGARISDMKAEQASRDRDAANAVLKKFTETATRINAAANDYTAVAGDLGKKLDTIQTDLKNVQAKSPLPHDCKPTSDRLRSLTAAVAAANSTAGH